MLQKFLEDSFTVLNNNYDYCVLRNYHSLPNQIGNDLDILVKPSQSKSIENIFLKNAVKHNLQFLKSVRAFGYVGLYFFDFTTGEVVLIDLFSRLQKRWRKYIEVEEVLSKRIIFKNFYVIHPSYEIYTVALKEILTYGYIRKKYLGRFQALNINYEEVREISQKYLNEKNVQLFLDYLTSFTNSEETESLKLSLSPEVKTIDQIKYSKFFLKRKLQDLFGVNPMICFIGPDGIGKSTLSAALSESITKANLFSSSKIYHHRFEIIPALSEILKGKKIEASGNEAKPAKKITNKKVHPQWKTLLYLSYYSLDFFLGWIIVMKARLKNQTIIFDRYYFDFLIQHHYSSIPKKFIKFIYWFLPKPNVTIFLYANPHRVVIRKNELTLEEHIEQNQRCLQVLREFTKKPIFLNCNGTVRSNIKLLKNIIFSRPFNE